MSKFRKGRSGNPGGRPKAHAEIAAAAREHSADALAALVRVIHDPKAAPSTVVMAANAILDRAHGRPAQSHDLRIANASAATATDADLLAIARGGGRADPDAEADQG